MARVKLTEYRAKSLLVDDYAGVQVRLASVDGGLDCLDPKTEYIIKVDQGVKKRGKQGLIQLNVAKASAKKAVRELAAKGYDNFIAEPMLPHEDSEERYLSVERMRDGFQFLYSARGGVDIEDNADSIGKYDDITKVPLPKAFMKHLTTVMDQQHLSFVEINPLVVRGKECILLDAAVLADSAGAPWATWSHEDIAEVTHKTKAGEIIDELNEGSPASFAFHVLNPDGAIWLLLSGGGASITIADEASNHGKADLIGNYGEYSGGPTREEVQIYTDAVLDQVFESKSKHRAIVIAGGVANFTDVRKTFAGIVDSLSGRIDELKAADIKVFVRRGGPNEKEGLALMKKFLETNGIYGSVHGSDKVLTIVINEALEHVDA